MPLTLLMAAVVPAPVNMTTSLCTSLYVTRAFTVSATICRASNRKHEVCSPVCDVVVCVFAYTGRHCGESVRENVYE